MDKNRCIEEVGKWMLAFDELVGCDLADKVEDCDLEEIAEEMRSLSSEDLAGYAAWTTANLRAHSFFFWRLVKVIAEEGAAFSEVRTTAANYKLTHDRCGRELDCVTLDEATNSLFGDIYRILAQDEQREKGENCN